MIRIASRKIATRILQRSHVGAISSFQPPIGHARVERPRTFTTNVERPVDVVVSASAVEDTLANIFKDQEVSNAVADVIAKETWNPVWYYVSDNAITAINTFRDVTGLGYGASIVAVTLAIRLTLFPLFVKLQRNQSRTAHMQPEMQAMKAQMDAMGDRLDRDTQLKHGRQMQALFKKYDCNPLSSLIGPVIQIPVFTGMFFGLQKMPNYFGTNMSTEGLLWFTDLTTYDPYYVLPIVSGLGMFASVEAGKAQMLASNPQQGRLMINVFRSMSIVMVPAISMFPAGLNLYWVTNNCVTAIQAGLFQNPSVRKTLGIWEMPKPVPGMPQPEGVLETIRNTIHRKPSEAERMKKHNESVVNKKKLAALTSSPVGRTGATLGRKKFRSNRGAT